VLVDVGKLKTSASGAFDLKVPIGSYRVTADSPDVDGGCSEWSAAAPAVVTRNRTIDVRVIFSIE